MPAEVIMPALGYGRIGADLQRMQAVAPSGCTAASSTEPCFGDIKASYLAADVHIRVGLTPAFALSLSGGYLLGLVEILAVVTFGSSVRGGVAFAALFLLLILRPQGLFGTRLRERI